MRWMCVAFWYMHMLTLTLEVAHPTLGARMCQAHVLLLSSSGQKTLQLMPVQLVQRPASSVISLGEGCWCFPRHCILLPEQQPH